MLYSVSTWNPVYFLSLYLAKFEKKVKPPGFLALMMALVVVTQVAKKMKHKITISKPFLNYSSFLVGGTRENQIKV